MTRESPPFLAKVSYANYELEVDTQGLTPLEITPFQNIAPIHINIIMKTHGRVSGAFSVAMDGSFRNFKKVPTGYWFNINLHAATKENGRLTTKPPGNTGKVYYLFKEDDSIIFELWDVSIVDQGGTFFTAIQRCYKSQIFRSPSGKMFMPEFENYLKWPQLQKLISSSLPSSVLSVRAPAEFPTPAEEIFQNHRGRVLWYNQARQVGAVALTLEGSYRTARVFWKEVSKRENDARFLLDGELVTFTDVKTPKEASDARHQTRFKHELAGVQPITP